MRSKYLLSGSYANKEQPGIVLWELDVSTGSLQKRGEINGVERPSFLAVHPNGTCFVAGSETGDGEVIAYWVNPLTGVIRELNRRPANGDHTAHVTIDESGQWVLSVTYSGATVSVYPLLADGSLGEMTASFRHEGKGINPERQDAAHPHSVLQLPGSNRFFVSDLGMDAVIRYRLDLNSGELKQEAVVKTAAGAGPRHLAFHPSRAFAYGANELDSTVSVYSLADGDFKEIQKLSTLPESYRSANTPAEVAVSEDGRFVYVSNRGHDSLAVFAVEGGSLKPIGHADAGGAGPRHFTLIKESPWMVVAHEQTGTIATLKIDENGVPGKIVNKVETVSPVCLRPLK